MQPCRYSLLAHKQSGHRETCEVGAERCISMHHTGSRLAGRGLGPTHAKNSRHSASEKHVGFEAVTRDTDDGGAIAGAE